MPGIMTNSGPVAGRFQGVNASDHAALWDQLWREKHTPWSRGLASPALVELLSRPDCALFSDVKPRRVLIPGAGEGHDAFEFVELWEKYGIVEVVSLDISQTAIDAAKQIQRRELHEPSQQAQVTFVLGDFFDESAEWGKTRFDVIYDYTVSLALACLLHASFSVLWIQE